MSRLRTGHGPDDWFDAGPETPHRFTRPYASVPAEVVGSMRPVLTAGAVFEKGQGSVSRAARRAYSIHMENRR